MKCHKKNPVFQKRNCHRVSIFLIIPLLFQCQKMLFLTREEINYSIRPSLIIQWRSEFSGVQLNCERNLKFFENKTKSRRTRVSALFKNRKNPRPKGKAARTKIFQEGQPARKNNSGLLLEAPWRTCHIYGSCQRLALKGRKMQT